MDPVTILILMRHGAAGTGRTDSERPLTSDGRQQSAAVGRWLRKADLVPERALVSPARRTVETFRGLGLDTAMTVTDALYDCAGRDILDEVNAVPGDVGVLLVVAHFPALPEAAAALDAAAGEVSFTPATAVVIELDAGPAAPGSGRLRDWFTP